MTWYLPFKISIAKTDVFAIECLDQGKWVVSFGLILPWLHAIFQKEKHLKNYVLKHENELYLP